MDKVEDPKFWIRWSPTVQGMRRNKSAVEVPIDFVACVLMLEQPWHTHTRTFACTHTDFVKEFYWKGLVSQT